MSTTPTSTRARATTFSVPKMDCPTEERIVRLAMEPLRDVLDVRVDLTNRIVVVRHHGEPAALVPKMEHLGFGAVLKDSVVVDMDARSEAAPRGERKVLILLLIINAVMFAAELAAGIIAGSTGLLADSLDMLGDAMVFGVSLYAVGAGPKVQGVSAKISGVIQLVLAAGVLSEVVRRAISGGEPASLIMIGAASVALAANLWCVWLLKNHREGGVHMKASWIFSTNDALANLGVVVAGVLVLVTESMVPDLVVGVAITALVTRSAVRILRLPS